MCAALLSSGVLPVEFLTWPNLPPDKRLSKFHPIREWHFNTQVTHWPVKKINELFFAEAIKSTNFLGDHFLKMLETCDRWNYWSTELNLVFLELVKLSKTLDKWILYPQSEFCVLSTNCDEVRSELLWDFVLNTYASKFLTTKARYRCPWQTRADCQVWSGWSLSNWSLIWIFSINLKLLNLYKFYILQIFCYFF